MALCFVQLDSERNLEEFKFMRASLSSVETSSFYQLGLINSRGMYHVGDILSEGAPSREALKMDNCIKVEIVADFGDRAAAGKVFRFPDLQDLQSKLILISGQSDTSKREEVEFFVEVSFICCQQSYKIIN